MLSSEAVIPTLKKETLKVNIMMGLNPLSSEAVIPTYTLLVFGNNVNMSQSSIKRGCYSDRLLVCVVLEISNSLNPLSSEAVIPTILLWMLVMSCLRSLNPLV